MLAQRPVGPDRCARCAPEVPRHRSALRDRRPGVRRHSDRFSPRRRDGRRHASKLHASRLRSVRMHARRRSRVGLHPARLQDAGLQDAQLRPTGRALRLALGARHGRRGNRRPNCDEHHQQARQNPGQQRSRVLRQTDMHHRQGGVLGSVKRYISVRGRFSEPRVLQTMGLSGRRRHRLKSQRAAAPAWARGSGPRSGPVRQKRSPKMQPRRQRRGAADGPSRPPLQPSFYAPRRAARRNKYTYM